MFKDSLTGWDLSDSGIETSVHTWSNAEDNPLVLNYVA